MIFIIWFDIGEKPPPKTFYKKRLFLKISQNSQENTCLFHLSPLSQLIYRERDSNTQVFSCEFRNIFRNTHFLEHLRANASDCSTLQEHFVKLWVYCQTQILLLSMLYCKTTWRPSDGHHMNTLVLNEFNLSIAVLFLLICRSNHRRCSVRKGVLRNFAKVTEKQLCHSLFLNKVAGLRAVTLLKKRLWYRCFLVNFAKFSTTSFLQNTSGGCFYICHKFEPFWFFDFAVGKNLITLHKKWNFPFRISSVNVIKSAVSCGFGHIYWRNP